MNRLFIISAIVLVSLGLGYLLYVNSGPSAAGTTLVTTGALGSTGQAKGASFDFAKALLSITTIKLDTAELVKNPAWSALTDFTTNLRTAQKGRKNPFAPIEKDFLVGSAQSEAPANSTATSTSR